MNLQRLREIWALSREGADHYHTSPLRIFLRFYHIKKRFLVPPEEACRLGMVDPKFDDSRLARRCISKAHFLKIQIQYNPRNLFGLTEDKAVFYAYCRGHRIPIPKLLAVIGPLGGWMEDGTPIQERCDWEAFFRERLPERFVIKPAGGCYGEGVRVFVRNGSSFEDNEGERRTAAQLYDHFVSGSLDSHWVLQEVLDNHPDIVRLTGSKAVSTCRMVTRIEASGDCRLLYAEFRIVTGHNFVDNFSHGETGNLASDLELDTGVLTQCKAFGMKWGCPNVETHPDTGIQFKGFQLPNWRKARELVESIAPKFLPARMLGWDVAFTPDGPIIIESNACWDPPNELDCMPTLIEALREEYEKLL